MKKKDEEKSKSQSEETIAERVKLRRQKTDDEDLSDMPPLESDEEEVKEGKGLKTLFNIISTNKSWKQFKQIQTNPIFSLSTQ